MGKFATAGCALCAFVMWMFWSGAFSFLRNFIAAIIFMAVVTAGLALFVGRYVKI